MNIGIVINTSWNIFNFRKGLIQALQKEGHSIIAIAPKDEYSLKLEEMGVKFVHLNLDSKTTNPIKDFKLIFELRRIYLLEKLDFVLQYTIKPNIYGTIATLFTNIKTVNNVSGLGTTFIRKNILSTLVQKMYRFSFKKASHVFFQNTDDLDLFIKNGIVKKEITGVLPGSGIPLDKIHYSEKQKTMPFTFFMPSRLLIDKGLGEFLEAAKAIKEEYKDAVKFVLCGKTEENPSLGFDQKTIEKWQETGVISFLGHVDDVIDLMHNVDVVVLPSYREGTPRALLEACAVGRPILTTNAPGCKEVIEDQVNGFICELRSSNSLYICMKKFLSLSEKERLEMGKASRRLVENKYDEKFVIEAYLNLIDNKKWK